MNLPENSTALRPIQFTPEELQVIASALRVYWSYLRNPNLFGQPVEIQRARMEEVMPLLLDKLDQPNG